MTRALAWLLVALGVAVVAETLWLGGGVGLLAGVLLVAVGALRLRGYTRQ